MAVDSVTEWVVLKGKYKILEAIFTDLAGSFALLAE